MAETVVLTGFLISRIVLTPFTQPLADKSTYLAGRVDRLLILDTEDCRIAITLHLSVPGFSQ